MSKLSELQDAQPITFDFAAAERLAARFRATADLLLTQVSQRTRLADVARKDWKGAYEVKFGHNMQICGQDAELLAFALRDAADQVDELARLAKEENDRRAKAREWKIAHDAWQRRQDQRSEAERLWDDLTNRDTHEPIPPDLNPAAPPKIPIHAPARSSR
jgi:uncharacterized protein YukE